MAHRIEFSPSAARQLRKLDRAVLEHVRDAIEGLGEEPRPHGCRKLSGHDSLYRVRVGDYRIVYAVFDHLLLVLLLKIGDRAEVYDRIRKSDLAIMRNLIGPQQAPPDE